ncbi:MAG: hypothetical protein KDL10_09985 [Kiritimatiellae bacterium]|nr:hypothetical protein [Kiritimatiellia bacterium]
MEMESLRQFFLWCTILNGGLLILYALIGVTGGGWIYRAHHRWFPISREAFDMILYSFLGLYKLLFIMFCLVPYLALSLLSSR